MCASLTALFFLVFLVALLYPAGAVGGSDFIPEQVCVTLQSDAPIHEFNARWGTTTLFALPENDLYLVAAPGVENLEGLAAQMSGDSAVVVAEPNYYLQKPECVRQMVIAAVGGTWDDYQDQTLTDRIGLEEAHSASTGTGIVVAVLDTGVDPTHEAFQGKLSFGGFDFVDQDPDPWEEANGQDDDDDGLIDEGHGHGSMVAGIVALVAPEATILPIRVLDDEGRGDLFTIVQGLLYALGRGADVLNMSFGTPVPVETITRHLELANVLGAVVTAGAGNEGREEPPYYPAADDRAFMITALDSLDIKATFADYHEQVVVSAPGVGVRSAYPGGEWGIGSGCSFAAPFVAGEAALILALEPGLPRDEVAARVEAGVEPINGIPGNEPYLGKLGTGRIFLPLALNAPTAAASGDPALQVVRVWPNPTRDVVYLSLDHEWGRASRIHLEIIDPAGRRLGIRSADPGAVLRWPLPHSDGEPLPAGIYYARLRCGDETHSMPFVVIR
ncbi:MAG: S8 family serine peptidase [Candidatus Eisenbacteria sp.]|nr:S8 family serine peptidase [Candidatus Eisenbacteria bacterium]